jgi:hypothetical protein
LESLRRKKKLNITDEKFRVLERRATVPAEAWPPSPYPSPGGRGQSVLSPSGGEIERGTATPHNEDRQSNAARF